ncbi:MAG: manganese efflux pump MntP family protein [Clostridia bacterium]|nr:manganese efflux pump MntP family protein [Clostridia bacterium]
MSIWEIILLGIGLSMDAAAISMANGMVYKNLRKIDYVNMPLFFGLSQGIMPILGYYLGTLFADFMESYSGIIVFVILVFIGGKMIWDGFHEEVEEDSDKSLNAGIIFFQAIATSIDAFAVGVGFCAMRVNIWSASSIIAISTGIISIIAILLGKKFGTLLEDKAQILGGVILVLIGIKALF